MIDAPKNRYLVNGHNYHNAILAIYLQVMKASSQKWHKRAFRISSTIMGNGK
jgi:hypothetical protein